MARKKHWLKRTAALLAAAALAFGLEALQIVSQPPQYEAEPRVIQEAGEADLEGAQLENAEYKSGAVNINAEGGAVTFDFGEEKEVTVLEIWAKKHIRKDVNLKIYYAAAGEEFSEERSVFLQADKGLMAWEPAVPAGKYERVRIEADGTMNIKRVVYSPEIAERVPVPEGLRLWRAALLIPFLFALILFLGYEKAGKRLADTLRRAWHGLTESGKRTAGHTVLFLAVAAAGYFLAKLLWLGGLQAEMNLPRQLFCGAAGMVFASLVTFRRTLGRKPEVLFVIVSLCAGLLMVCLFPPMLYISWDDEYHFDQALTWSYLGEKRVTPREDINLQFDADPLEWFDGDAAREEILSKGQMQYDQGVDFTESEPLESKNVCEAFAGIGLFSGRVLRLPYHWIYCMGKFFNLLVYTACGFFAIRRLKSGKMMLAAALLAPTAVFLASQYAYDPGLTAFTALGLAYAFAEWQEPEKRVTWERALIIFGSLTFGCLTKAVYFPLLLIPMTLPKRKFQKTGKSSGRGTISRRSFLLLGAACVMILLATFMIPLVTGGTESDMRGGAEVNAYGQVHWILENPFQYARVLVSFLMQFLNWQNGTPTLVSFAYMGFASYGMVYLILLGVLALTDKTETDRSLARSVLSRALSLLALLAVLVLISTALYVAYTGVGSETIQGVQHRYLIPLLFPFMMILGSGLISRPLKLGTSWRREVYNGLAFTVVAWVLFNGIWETCISRFIL